MQPQAGETLEVMDGQEQHLGWMALESDDAGLLSGRFTPGPHYAAVQPLFRAFEEAVELQGLSAVDRLDARLASLGLQLRSAINAVPIPVHDVQIWSDGGMTCRVGGPLVRPLNGTPSGNEASTAGEGVSVGNSRASRT